ncbi:hypothetical protein [Palleronia caenipelagi]|uniref:Uncharacterized protein n=1 Tax=Palleronia caenipelagi TaxID=2489174 RepID=A0A547Q5C6_9RHOB|nr:hypothetical protein [Palleronia caenipelagi]TRD21568.1 hypothetical protein FEV53_08790 [Palleronia caenipelagi]
MSIARKNGVGVIVAQDMKDWDPWYELIPAKQNNPYPGHANGSSQFVSQTKPKTKSSNGKSDRPFQELS